ncbi:MAG: Rid family detoxifying hydrolase [Verrucomicrobiia bacterium]
MGKQIIVSDKVMPAVGPYSQGVAWDKLIFLAGQIPVSKETGKLVEGDIRTQTRQVLENITSLLQSAGSSTERVLKATVFLTDLAQFAAMNEVYRDYFSKEPPARSTIQVVALPLGAQVEIEVIAYRD